MLLRAAPLRSCEQDLFVRVGLLFTFNHYLNLPNRLAKMRFQMSSCHLQRRRSRTTVCRLWPHSQRELVTPGTLRSKSRSLSPMLSMHDCTMSQGWVRVLYTEKSGESVLLFYCSSIIAQLGPRTARLVTEFRFTKALGLRHTSSALSRSVEALVALDHLCGGCSRVCMLLDPCPRSSVCLSVSFLSAVCTIV